MEKHQRRQPESIRLGKNKYIGYTIEYCTPTHSIYVYYYIFSALEFTHKHLYTKVTSLDTTNRTFIEYDKY